MALGLKEAIVWAANMALENFIDLRAALTEANFLKTTLKEEESISGLTTGLILVCEKTIKCTEKVFLAEVMAEVIPECMKTI